MCSDIFSFNLNNISRILLIILIIIVIIHKYLRVRYDMRIRGLNITISLTIVYRLMIALIPHRLILQGGINIHYIIFIGLIFSFISNYISFKYYKMIPSSPIILIPLIIIIEFVRLLIRPISLILRIVINLTIGHIVMYILIYPLTLVYNLIEIFIYCIQIYIFWTLISIYSK